MPKKQSSNGKYQLNVWISEQADAYLTQCYERDGRHRNEIIERLIQQDIAVHAGERVERQSLPVINESIDTALRKYTAQLRTDLREDMQLEIVEAVRTISRASDNRLAGLIVRTMRDAGIIRRMLFAFVAKRFGTEFATEAYEDAKAKAGAELAARTTTRKEQEAK